MPICLKSRAALAAIFWVCFQALALAAKPQTDNASIGPKPSVMAGVSVSLTDKPYKQLIDAALSALQQRLEQDPPFLWNERQSRLQRVSQLPVDTAQALTEKYRRLLEAYRIELDYANSLEAYRELLSSDADSRLVEFLRIGRLALYYQTLNGRESAIWDRHRRQWLRLSNEDNEKITQGLRIAKKLEPPQLMVLPLFGAEQVKDATAQPPAVHWAAGMDATANTAQQSDSVDKESLLAETRAYAAALDSYGPLSLSGAGNEDAEKLLALFAAERHTPSLDEWARLFALSSELLRMQAGITRSPAQVYIPDGHPAEREVLRIGNFTLLAAGRYLSYDRELGHLLELPRQPAAGMLDMADSFARQDTTTLANVAIDPSAGQALQLLVQIPNLSERIAQGGPVGYLILLLAGFAYLLGGYRFFHLSLIGKRMRKQLQSREHRLDNPLGRILAKVEHAPMTNHEALSLLVEEALIEEQARLDYALTFLKLIAAIAPMLGLLGTVTGMIETFQAIAMHGTGDPKLMSGGISEALVTTVEGLVTAIPILLLHSVLSSQSQAFGILLEAHAAAALAQRLEQQTLDAGHPAAVVR